VDRNSNGAVMTSRWTENRLRLKQSHSAQAGRRGAIRHPPRDIASVKPGPAKGHSAYVYVAVAKLVQSRPCDLLLSSLHNFWFEMSSVGYISSTYPQPAIYSAISLID